MPGRPRANGARCLPCAASFGSYGSPSARRGAVHRKSPVLKLCMGCGRGMRPNAMLHARGKAAKGFQPAATPGRARSKTGVQERARGKRCERGQDSVGGRQQPGRRAGGRVDMRCGRGAAHGRDAGCVGGKQCVDAAAPGLAAGQRNRRAARPCGLRRAAAVLGLALPDTARGPRRLLARQRRGLGPRAGSSLGGSRRSAGETRAQQAFWQRPPAARRAGRQTLEEPPPCAVAGGLS